jgi:hypothetical protein
MGGHGLGLAGAIGQDRGGLSILQIAVGESEKTMLQAIASRA